jgi:hypothetical protein
MSSHEPIIFMSPLKPLLAFEETILSHSVSLYLKFELRPNYYLQLFASHYSAIL